MTDAAKTMRFDDLVAAIGPLRPGDLQVWIEEAWVAPLREGAAFHFSEMECARVRLICTLHYEYEIETETMPVILSLLDQLYDTRRRLGALTAAVAAQDIAVRDAVLEAAKMRDAAGTGDAE